MKNSCIEVSVCSEKLYKLFLDLIKIELESLSITDINSIQALTLLNIGKNSITVGELTVKGYYAGSNASYNIKKMVANDYIKQEQSKHDKRSSYISLSEKGLSLFQKLETGLKKYTTVLQQNKENHIEKCIEKMKKVESIWKGVSSR